MIGAARCTPLTPPSTGGAPSGRSPDRCAARRAGTNALLADQALVVRDAGDVLVALGLGRSPLLPTSGGTPTGVVGGTDAAVLDAVGFAPTPTGEVVACAAVGLGPALTALHRLAAAGLVEAGPGCWSRRSSGGR